MHGPRSEDDGWSSFIYINIVSEHKQSSALFRTPLVLFTQLWYLVEHSQGSGHWRWSPPEYQAGLSNL